MSKARKRPWSQKLSNTQLAAYATKFVDRNWSRIKIFWAKIFTIHSPSLKNKFLFHSCHEAASPSRSFSVKILFESISHISNINYFSIINFIKCAFHSHVY